MKPRILASFIFCLLLYFTCCTSVKIPASKKAPDKAHDWSSELTYGLNQSSEDLSEWWRVLNDPLLNQLIDGALTENLNLSSAASRVREARAQRGIAEAGRFPTFQTSGSVQRVKQGEFASDNLFSSGFDAGWELDLFGRVRNNLKAAQADLEAAQESYYDVRISLIAEVALNYVEYRSFQNRLRIARENVRLQTESLRITKARFEGKLVSPLDMRQAETNLLNTEAGISPLWAGLVAARNRLCTLLGKKPGELDDLLPDEVSNEGGENGIPLPPGQIAVGIPADVMRRRPDIRQAERQLAAQSARVGVAKAELYPKFRLTGNLSFSAANATNLFTATSRSMALGPSFEWNIFSGGSIRNNIKVQNERQKQALLAYEQSILSALEEIESALTAFANENDRNAKLMESAVSASEAHRLSRLQYEAGLIDFTNVLDTERSLLNQQDQQVVSQAEITSNLIRLYKALGGGWSAEALKSAK
jgi:NodT family efflux transporter outer membrane factor (OMF) lipoprotein